MIPYWAEDEETGARLRTSRYDTPAGYYEAKWPPILDRDVSERLRDILSDPSRRTNHGNANAPRCLLSGIAQCGICGDSTLVKVNGGGYSCGGGKVQHLHRSPARTDDYVERVIIARLSQPDIAEVLVPPERPGADTAALRTEVRKLRKRKTDLAAMFADGTIDAADLATGRSRSGDALRRPSSS